MEIIEELEEIEFITNNKELEEKEYMMNNEEMEEMEFSINNEELEEMEFSMNNEKMDSNPCFPETITNSLLQTTLKETTHAGESSVPTRNKKELTNEQRLTIFHFLLKENNKGRLQKDSNLPFDVSSQKPTRVGPKSKKVDFSKIMEIPLRRRTSIRSMAESLNMPKSTGHRYIKK
ncbi:hypothetical protein MKX03_034267 [Papaver bracteatum]|nr:hypothetical protein MKX03_034267 [Papaver bracteatum]